MDLEPHPQPRSRGSSSLPSLCLSVRENVYQDNTIVQQGHLFLYAVAWEGSWKTHCWMQKRPREDWRLVFSWVLFVPPTGMCSDLLWSSFRLVFLKHDASFKKFLWLPLMLFSGVSSASITSSSWDRSNSISTCLQAPFKEEFQWPHNQCHTVHWTLWNKQVTLCPFWPHFNTLILQDRLEQEY